MIHSYVFSVFHISVLSLNHAMVICILHYSGYLFNTPTYIFLLAAFIFVISCKLMSINKLLSLLLLLLLSLVNQSIVNKNFLLSRQK